MLSQNQIQNIFNDLFPLNRSLTGPGVLKTFEYLRNEHLKNAHLKSIKSGSIVFDWRVPPEWTLYDAYIKNGVGKKIIDIADSNLHVASYSSSVNDKISKEELLKRLYTLPSQPDVIPYRTTYYKKDWAFCCKHTLIESKNFVGPFEVYIDSKHDEYGKLNWLEATKQGSLDKEILISTYCCHPSLANDNLSGIVLAVLLFKFLETIETKFTYRLLIAPETIGAISFLHQSKVDKIAGGMILTCVAGPDKFSLKEGFDNKHWINQAAKLALEKHVGEDYIKYPFVPDGSDERQYSSPGFRIVTPSIHKSKYYEYSEYHTSADNLEFISAQNLIQTYEVYKTWVQLIESYSIPKRVDPFCEFQLGKHDLYPSVGGGVKQMSSDRLEGESNKQLENELSGDFPDEMIIDGFNWLMHLADGNYSNFDVANRANLDLQLVNTLIDKLENKGLLKKL